MNSLASSASVESPYGQTGCWRQHSSVPWALPRHWQLLSRARPLRSRNWVRTAPAAGFLPAWPVSQVTFSFVYDSLTAARGRSAPPFIATVGLSHMLKRASPRAVALIGEPKPRRLTAAGTITGSVDDWLCHRLH